MKTKKFVLIMIIVISIIGYNEILFAQPSWHKQKEYVFVFGGSVMSNFIGMELLNDSSVFARGIGVTGAGYNNSYVSLVNFGSVVWERNVFAATNESQFFYNDISVYKTATNSSLYATTERGANVYSDNGAIIDSSIILLGLKSKLIQRTSQNLMATKVINNKVYLYRLTLSGQVIDSLLITEGVVDIQSRCYEPSSKSWFLTLRLIGINTAIIRVDSSGLIWQHSFLNTDRSWVTADEDRAYVVSDAYNENFSAFRTKLRTYNHNGDLLWEKIYIPTVTIDSVALSKCITLYPGGGCTIAGVSGFVPSTYQGSFVTTFGSDGQMLWEKIFPGESNRCPLAIVWNSKKELIVSGSDLSKCYIANYFIDGVTGINDHGLATLPSSFVLNQNYPNPFNPTTTISYYLPISTQVQLLVCNSLGQVVAELVNGFENSGEKKIVFNADNLSSGVYFIRFMAGTTVLTRKMLLVK